VDRLEDRVSDGHQNDELSVTMCLIGAYNNVVRPESNKQHRQYQLCTVICPGELNMFWVLTAGPGPLWLSRSQAVLSPSPLAPQLAAIASALPAKATDSF
jgi:hypothetical protein